MRPIEAYVTDVMKKKGIKSFNQLSQELRVSHNAVFNIMSKGGTPSDELCKKLADLAGDPVEKVLILAAESRAPESTKNAWERILKAAAQAGVFTLGLMLFSMAAPPLAQASMEKTVTKSFDITRAEYPLCDMIRMTLRRLFRRFFDLSLCPV